MPGLWVKNTQAGKTGQKVEIESQKRTYYAEK